MRIELSNIPNKNAIEIADEWNTYKIKIIDRFGQLMSKVSFYDKEREDILHAMENLNLDAVTMAKMGKELKQISKERREIKEELCVVQALRDFVKDKKVVVNTNKTYMTKTNVLDKYLLK